MTDKILNFIQQRTLHNLPLLAGGFFVISVFILIIGNLEINPVFEDLPNSPRFLFISQSKNQFAIIAQKINTLPNTDLSANDLLKFSPKMLVFAINEYPLDFGIITKFSFKELSRFSIQRIGKNPYVRPLGGGTITISSSKEFYNEIKTNPKSIPFWNLVEVYSLLNIYGGVIRDNKAPSELGIIKTENQSLVMDLSRSMYTNSNNPQQNGNFLNNINPILTTITRPEVSVLTLPDNTSAIEYYLNIDKINELGQNNINLNLVSKDNAVPSGKICFKTNEFICF